MTAQEQPPYLNTREA